MSTNEEDEQLTPSNDPHVADDDHPELSGINGAGDIPPDEGVEPVDDEDSGPCEECGEVECVCGNDVADQETDNPFPEGTLRHELWNAMMLGKDWPDDKLLVNTPEEPSQGYTTPEEPDHIPDERGDTDGAEVSNADSEDEGLENQSRDDESAEDMARRVTGKTDSHEEDEEAKIDPIRKAITTPGNPLKDALKAIEQEGSSAWDSMKLPLNPHPPKSKLS